MVSVIVYEWANIEILNIDLFANERIILSYGIYFVCLNESKTVIFLYFLSHISIYLFW